MAIPPESPVFGGRVDRRWLWAVRVAALLGLLFFLGVFLSFHWRDPEGFPAYLSFIVSLPVSLPYLVILWRLRRQPHKEGLAVAVAWGALMAAAALLVLLLLLAEEFPQGDGWKWAGLLGFYGLFIGNHAVIARGGVKLYYQLEKEPRDKRTLAWGVVAAGFFFGLALMVMVALPGLLRSPSPANESTAVGTLRTLNVSLEAHASTYPQCGFPDSLADLKPAGTPGPQQSDLLDPVLAQDTFTKSGYVFSYRLMAGKGDCQAEPGTGYELAARPLQFRKTGQRSFFVDQTGAVRSTEENRAATGDDPPL